MRGLVLLLTACGADYTGRYTIDAADFVVNDCMDDGTLLPTGTLDILADRTQIELDLGSPVPPIDCDRSGRDFDCDTEEFATDIQGSARLSTTFTPSGRLGPTLELTLDGTTTCQGGDCATIESISDLSFPCAMTIDLTATP